MSVIWTPRESSATAVWRERARELTVLHFAPLAAELDREQRYPHESVDILRRSGIGTMFLPEAYGGAGASLSALAAAVEEIAKGCASTSAIVAALQLGTFPILLEGSEQQKQTYLQGLIERGEAVCFALSERGAGSDAAAIATTASREGEGFRIRGEKCWLGNGGVSRHYVVFARSDPEAGARGITAYLVDRAHDGVVIDVFEDKMGIRGTLTSNLKLDTWVHESAVLGAPGRGLRLALKTLNVGRVTVAAQALGIGLAAYEASAAYACERRTFGRPIIEHQAIGFRLADVAIDLSAARMLLFEAARCYDEGGDVATPGAMAKLYASEASHRAVDAAVQIHGGYGYVKPSAVERYYRDQRITEIYEGTSEIQRLVLARAIQAEAERQRVADA
jgi:alkylation response protein AidB-like acyl-CoA dehydrogenase